MKVLDLRCEQAHRFEGWFASESDYQSQVDRGVLACPVCESKVIARLPSSPRLNVSKASPPPELAGSSDQRSADPATNRSAVAATDPQQQMQANWLRAIRHVLKNTDDVGDRFPEEARRIHYGETEPRGIRGVASNEEAQALKDEGIEVNALPLPEALKGPVQ